MQVRRLVHAARDPFDRESFDPGHVTASAFVLSPDRGAVLLVRHAVLGRWLQPGGHVEPHDPTVVDAARREVAEEVGIAIPAIEAEIFDVDVHLIPSRNGCPAHLHHDVRFLFLSPTLDFAAASDAEGAAWVPLAVLSGLEDSRSFRRAARKLVAAAF